MAEIGGIGAVFQRLLKIALQDAERKLVEYYGSSAAEFADSLRELNAEPVSRENIERLAETTDRFLYEMWHIQELVPAQAAFPWIEPVIEELAQGFEHTKTSKIIGSPLISGAQEAHFGGRYSDALTLMGTLTSLNGHYATAREYFEKAKDVALSSKARPEYYIAPVTIRANVELDRLPYMGSHIERIRCLREQQEELAGSARIINETTPHSYRAWRAAVHHEVNAILEPNSMAGQAAQARRAFEALTTSDTWSFDQKSKGYFETPMAARGPVPEEQRVGRMTQSSGLTRATVLEARGIEAAPSEIQEAFAGLPSRGKVRNRDIPRLRDLINAVQSPRGRPEQRTELVGSVRDLLTKTGKLGNSSDIALLKEMVALAERAQEAVPELGGMGRQVDALTRAWQQNYQGPRRTTLQQ
ncbi:MAG: hypothetical protein HOQ05_07080 [Corynebacteriales bacterium]|nr:hypothetical protein [Mycobacteriales bacterium]